MPHASAPIRKTLHALAAVLGIVSAPSAFVGDWVSYSDFSVPNCMIAWHGELFVGTSGGVRRVGPDAPYPETHFNNMQGLLDVRIVGLTVDADDKLWAASHSGQLFRFEGSKWSAWGKSYRASGWTINPRAVAAAGRYIIIGSKQGLSLFDRTTGLAAVNLTKFGNQGQQPITSVLPVGDTLYIATGKAVLKAAVDWKNALSNRFGATIYDPSIWKIADNLAPLPGFVADRTPGDTVEWTPEQDSARAREDARPVELALSAGRVFAHDTGTILAAPIPVKALGTRPPVIDGKAVPDSAVLVTAAALNGTVFAGGPKGLIIYHPVGGFAKLHARSPLPEQAGNGAFRRPAAVTATAGGALIMTGDGVYDLGGDGRKIFGTPNLREVYTNELRGVSSIRDGGVLIAGWGFGLARMITPDSLVIADGSNSCLHAVLPGFTVIRSMSDPRGNDVWMTLLENVSHVEKYLTAHLDLATGKVTCPDVEGNSNHTLATRILSDTVFAVAGSKGIQLFRYGIGGVKGSVQKAGSLNGGSGSDIGRDMAMDGHDRLWALMNGKLGYVDTLSGKLGPEKTPEVAFLDGFPGKNCGVMEADVRKGLWIGCENGVYHLTPGAQASQSEYEHYDTEDGLLGDLVSDLSMDPTTGRLWVVTENGVNRFQSEAKPFISGAEGVKAYPNPFREKHRMLVIDNLPKGATGAIFTQSGNAVRRFASRDARGNQFQWDGTNEAGNRVKPGIYLYSVSAPSGSSRGKIIVAR